MDPLLAASLAGAADAVAPLLAGACDVTRVTRTPAGNGGAITATVTVAAAVPCRVSPAGRAERELVAGARRTVELAYTVPLPAGTDVRAGDQLALDDGRTLDVVAVPTYTLTVLTRAVCVQTGSVR